MNFKLVLLKKCLFFLIVFFGYENFAQENQFIEKADDFFENYNYDSAHFQYQKALPFIKTATYLKRGNFFIKYAKSLKSISKADSAFYYLDEADKIFSKYNRESQEELFYIKTLKAETCRYLGQNEKSKHYIQEAQRLYNSDYNQDKIAYYLNRKMALIANQYSHIPDSVKVIHTIYNKILKLENQIKDKSILVYSLNEIAYLDFNSNPQKACRSFKKAFNLAIKYKTYQALIDVSKNIGMYYQQKEANFIEAIKYHEISLKYAKQINNLSQIDQAYFSLRCCYHLNNSLEKAIYYTDSTLLVKLIIKENENTNLLKEFEIKNNIKKKEQELRESKKTTYLIIIILVVVLIGLFVLYYFSNKINNKNKKLAKLYHENEFLVSETNHRINNNLQLISLLIGETIRKNKKENKENIDLIRLQSKIQSIALLHRELYDSKDKKTVDLQLYFAKIEESFSEICTNEKIILKLNVDSIDCNSDAVMYMGLLVTELIINSIKHAFENIQVKNINIEIVKIQNKFQFNYSDNGQKNKNIDFNPILAKQLCQQIGVNPEIVIKNGFHLSFIKSIENA